MRSRDEDLQSSSEPSSPPASQLVLFIPWLSLFLSQDFDSWTITKQHALLEDVELADDLLTLAESIFVSHCHSSFVS